MRWPARVPVIERTHMNSCLWEWQAVVVQLLSMLVTGINDHPGVEGEAETIRDSEVELFTYAAFHARPWDAATRRQRHN